MKTPGVYIVEKSAFPASTVEVATAVPAFIGYTEKADNKGRSLANKPWRITSLAEFHDYFGSAPFQTFSIDTQTTTQPEAASEEQPQAGSEEQDETGAEGQAEDSSETPAEAGGSVETMSAPEEAGFSFGGSNYNLTQQTGNYLLYNSIRLFYANGGGPCYIVSVGTYGDDVEASRLQSGISLLVKEQEPTMVVIPDATLLSAADCISTQQASLGHCAKMMNRFSILDIHDGFKDRQDPSGDCIDEFRNAVGINYLDYAAAYYPWVNTTIVQDGELSYDNITNKEVLQSLLKQELEIPEDLSGAPARVVQQSQTIDEVTRDWTQPDAEGNTATAEEIASNKTLLHKSLMALSPQLYGSILREIKDKLNLLPPGAAMAGIYTMVDNSRGVWKAPANVSLSAVTSPSVNITHDDQEDLNVTPQGKSINAIRPFIGEGVLVWGGRTLDGNSLDWRYIQVRRTMIMLEESIKLATKAYVFENNVATTWVTIKSMIRNFLTGIWKRGGLAGASPDDAFAVFVGLGETMTPEDILEGILRVTVLVALVRPAEFIEITFQQQMQQS
jgi:phage tail sheath protein FI